MDFEEWYQENENKGLNNRDVTPTHESVGGYPGFFKDKLQAAYNAGLSEKDKQIEEVEKEKDIIINFLKKELMHKTSYRQVMKRQYRELKQKYNYLAREIHKIASPKPKTPEGLFAYLVSEGIIDENFKMSVIENDEGKI